MADKRKSPRVMRIRDFAAGASVLMAGFSMTYAIWTQGSSTAVNLMILCFGAAGVMIIIAYTFGAIFDRLARLCPSFFKPRQAGTWTFALIPLLAAGVWFVWSERSTILPGLARAAQQMLEKIADLPFA